MKGSNGSVADLPDLSHCSARPTSPEPHAAAPADPHLTGLAFVDDATHDVRHGLITAVPAASKGPVSRVATAKPLVVAMAAM